MRYPAAEKIEIIRIVEQSHLSARKTLDQIGVAHEGVDYHNCPSIHLPRMMVDEAALPRGAALLAGLAGLAERFLAQGWG